MLYLMDSVQLVQWIPYQGNFGGFRDFKIEGQAIRTVKYAYDLVLLAREEMLLQVMIDRLIGIGRCSGMEMNVEKLKVLDHP